MARDDPSVTAVKAMHEAARAHDRQDGHELLCTERWTQMRGSVDDIKGAVAELRAEMRAAIGQLHDRLNKVLADDAREARNAAGWWRGATFRWLGWGVALVAAVALAAVKLN